MVSLIYACIPLAMQPTRFVVFTNVDAAVFAPVSLVGFLRASLTVKSRQGLPLI